MHSAMEAYIGFHDSAYAFVLLMFATAAYFVGPKGPDTVSVFRG